MNFDQDTRIFIYSYCVVLFSILLTLFDLQWKINPINSSVQVTRKSRRSSLKNNSNTVAASGAELAAVLAELFGAFGVENMPQSINHAGPGLSSVKTPRGCIENMDICHPGHSAWKVQNHQEWLWKWKMVLIWICRQSWKPWAAADMALVLHGYHCFTTSAWLQRVEGWKMMLIPCLKAHYRTDESSFPTSSRDSLFQNIPVIVALCILLYVSLSCLFSSRKTLIFWCSQNHVVFISFVLSLHYRYGKNWNVQEHAKCRNHKENDRRIWWGRVYK